MASKSARKRKRAAKRKAANKNLSRRRKALRSLIRPHALASKDGIARADAPHSTLLQCSADGLLLYNVFNYQRNDLVKPWNTLSYAMVENMEEVGWGPNQPLHPLEKLAEVAL